MTEMNRRKDRQAKGLSPEDIDAFSMRSQKLGRKIEAHKKQKSEVGKTHSTENTAYRAAASQGFKIAVELVVGVCFGGLIGYSLDSYFHTSGPWFLICFIIIGFAAGMSNVIRMAKRMQAEAEEQQQSVLVEPRDNNGAET